MNLLIFMMKSLVFPDKLYKTKNVLEYCVVVLDLASFQAMQGRTAQPALFLPCGLRRRGLNHWKAPTKQGGNL